MKHQYQCERCKKVKTCQISGCMGNCVNVCGKCAREAYREVWRKNGGVKVECKRK
jgi:endonuclease YncB( thermonuclease family)